MVSKNKRIFARWVLMRIVAVALLSIFSWAFLTPTRFVQAETQGAFLGGNQLYQLCLLPTPDICLGYVDGIADAINWPMLKGKLSVCFPDSVVGQQLIDIVKSYLEKNPAVRHYSASSLVLRAFSEAFPCPK
jgi:Rap1a immunity proteins